MYNVLIAEDEPLIRIGLKHYVNWPSFDMEVVSDVGSGAQALAAYRALRPDVLIVDLRMPEIDGISLIEQVRALDADVAIIVVSCVEDFTTLQRATHLGISDYLLKATMTPADMEAALAKARRQMDVRRPERAGGESAPPADAVMRYLLHATDVAEAADSACAFFCFMPGNDPMLMDTVYALIATRLKRRGELSLYSLPTCFTALFPAGSDALIEEMRRVQAWLISSFGCRADLLVRREATPLARVREALDALRAQLVQGYWICGDGFCELDASLAADLPTLTCEGALCEGAEDWIAAQFGRALAESAPRTPNEFRKRLYEESRMILEPYFRVYPDAAAALCTRISDAETAREARDLALAFCRKICAEFGALLSNRAFALKACQYIRANARRSLTLSEIAAQVGFSANYFSSIFAREMGMSPTMYVNRCRIERAKELLRTARTISDIATECGFPEETYFSKRFKQETGLRPSEYRSQLTKGNPG